MAPALLMRNKKQVFVKLKLITGDEELTSIIIDAEQVGTHTFCFDEFVLYTLGWRYVELTLCWVDVLFSWGSDEFILR